MRSFTQFLARRKVKDVLAWCRSLGINSLEQLSSFCHREQLSIVIDDYQYLFEIKETSERLLKRKQPANSAPGDSETWHVPAAERPVKKRRRVRKNQPKKTKKE